MRVRAEGICGSDLNFYRRLDEPETVPGGHETAGEIVEVGAGVDPSIIGQRVAVEVIRHGNACLSAGTAGGANTRTAPRNATGAAAGSPSTSPVGPQVAIPWPIP